MRTGPAKLVRAATDLPDLPLPRFSLARVSDSGPLARKIITVMMIAARDLVCRARLIVIVGNPGGLADTEAAYRRHLPTSHLMPDSQSWLGKCGSER